MGLDLDIMSILMLSRSSRDISIFGLGGHIAISGCGTVMKKW